MSSNSILLDILQNFKTGNVVFDTIMISVCFGLFASLMNSINISNICMNTVCDVETYKSFFFRRNQICISGKIITKAIVYHNMNVDTKFSNNFRAIWYLIERIVQHNKQIGNIYSVKEYPCKKSSLCENMDNRRGSNQPMDTSTLLIVNQRGKFMLDEKKQIYAVVNCYNERADVKDNGMGCIETIEIKIFSYISKLCDIHDFIKENTAEYQLKIDNLRYNKLFIYEYSDMIVNDGGNDAGNEIVWNECAFESARTFNNIFFQDKVMLLRKVDYFVRMFTFFWLFNAYLFAAFIIFSTRQSFCTPIFLRKTTECTGEYFCTHFRISRQHNSHIVRI